MSEKLYVSADQQQRDAFRLARTIYDSGWVPDVLIGLWRGGTPIAITIHEFLKWKNVDCVHMPVKCTSYMGMKQTPELKIDFPMNMMFDIKPGSKVIVIDDCFDSGKTAMAMKDLLEQHGAEVRICVVYWKPDNNKTNGKPDYYVYSVKADQWIVFPHELEDLSSDEIAAKDPELLKILGIE